MPSGGYPEVADPARRVDPETGAPVNVSGPLSCEVRTLNGIPTGPDGDPATLADNEIPSIGNCLLLDNPAAPESMQTLRSAEAIAASHSADQAMFADLCSATFDPYLGVNQCDSWNDDDLWPIVAGTLAGSGLTQGLAVEGYQFVRPQGSPFNPLDRTPLTPYGPAVFSLLTARLPVIGSADESTSISAATSAAQAALLGCGDAFLNPCDPQDAQRFADPAISSILASLPLLRGGGLDLLNTDASVLSQDFAVPKALSPGALVGTRRDDSVGSYFEAGVSVGAVSTELATQFGISPAAGVTAAEAASLGNPATQTVQQRIADLFGAASFGDLTRAQQTLGATDFQLEKSKWFVEPAGLAQGFVVFRDPRFPGSSSPGPYTGYDGVAGTADDFWDPSGEDCTPVFGRPDPGCTALEVISANVERLSIATEIVGVDRAFDPPETLAEIVAILDGDPANNALGDPVSGADGIRFNDFDRNADGIVTDEINEDGDQKVVLHRASASSIVAADAFSDCLVARALNFPVCYLNLDRTSVTADPGFSQGPGGPSIVNTTQDRLVAALPIGAMLSVFQGSTDAVAGFRGTLVFPLQRLAPLGLQQFAIDDRIVVSASLFTTDELSIANAQLTSNPQLGPITASDTLTLRPQGQIATTPRQCPGGVAPCFVVSGGATFRTLMLSRSVDGDTERDLDADLDDTFDFLDDGTRGPVEDDSPLCGSGLPGDPLQDVAQHELDIVQLQMLTAAGGIPPRSPSFCASTRFLLGGISDSASGRRDFAWHGGEPVDVGDGDGDAIPDAADNCTTVSNSSQFDTDDDGVGDACDNCTTTRNPLVETPGPFTTTGGQRDDDADGFGNACDAQFVSAGPVVIAADFNAMKASVAKPRSASTCGVTHNLSCARFDLDGVALLINVLDFNQAKRAVGKAPGPRCSECGNFSVLPCAGPGCPPAPGAN